ncbi:MAG TPA: helix-turn-helix transcriptional regulator, partial [Pseudonocardiaceae bacterium]|nr:helix-turn-helix transcriptional regulator [Pseudonocardiaceae bacterium]
MALRRQGLSQRRRAVGLTQESLAQLLGVERSTVVRWEAGDTEPLPSIRPSLARALNMSIDHLAELLAESKNIGTARTPSVSPEVTIPAARPPVAAELDHPIAADPPATIAFNATPATLPNDIAHP